MVEHDDVGTLVGEALTMHPTRAAAGTGDQDDLVAQTRHHGALIRSKPLYPAAATSLQMSR